MSENHFQLDKKLFKQPEKNWVFELRENHMKRPYVFLLCIFLAKIIYFAKMLDLSKHDRNYVHIKRIFFNLLRLAVKDANTVGLVFLQKILRDKHIL